MGFWDFFKKKQKEYQEIQEERSAIKDEIRESLKGLNFTELEIKEVLIIVDKAEKTIDLLKAKLVGSNVGMDYPGNFINHIHSEIDKATKRMQIDLKIKVQEILVRRKNG